MKAEKLPPLRSKTSTLLPPVLSVLLTLILNFDRLLLQPATRIGGEPGSAAFALWAVWWPQFARRVPDGLIINAYNGAPYLSNHLGYLPLLPSFLFGLLHPLLGPVLAFNLLLLISQAATQVCLYGFLRSKRVPVPVALLAAAAFVLTPWYAGLVGRADVIGIGLWPLPLALLIWDRWRESPTWPRALGVVAVLYAALLSGVQHLAWIVALWLPYALWTGRDLWHGDAGADEGPRASRGQLSLIALLLITLFLIYPAPALIRTLQGNEPAFASAVVSPLPLRRSFIGLLKDSGPLIWLFAMSAFFFAPSSRRTNVWLVTGGLCLLVAFGLLPEPLRVLAGALALPYQPLYDYEMFYGLALFALLVYGCSGWGEAWGSLANPLLRRGMLAGALGLILLTGPAVLRPLETHTVAAPPFYGEIAAEPEDYLLLVYPFGLQNADGDQALGEGAYLIREAVWHHKRTLSGIGHYEPEVYQNFEAMPFLFPESLPAGELDEAAEALGVAVREWRMGYVVAHADLLSAEALQAVDELATRSDALCPAVRHGNLIVYRARWHPYGCEGR